MTSCIEIFDDLTLHNDGTGTFKYNVNLSASRLKINSILALDSLNGKKIPSISEIQDEIERIKILLSEKEGISNVKVENNFDDFIFKFQCDFQSITDLEDAIKSIIESENLVKNLENMSDKWFLWEENKFQRIIPDVILKNHRELNASEIDELSKGKYISVTRFDRIINTFDNENARLSASKTAIMLQTNIYALILDANLLENTIQLNQINKQ
jgi:hypothetical protein